MPLLAVIALDGPVAADRVAALLWPAVDARRADTSLRQRLYRLRRQCGDHLVATGSLLLLTPGVETDLAAALARIADDADAARNELLGELDFDESPELAE
jgi:DNA-binding SARP family transcriptional activator